MKGFPAQALLVVAAVALSPALICSSEAAESPYTGLESREIKALSPEQIAGYEAGRGMGLALAAELNGYPGPKHVLELGEELQLSEEQRQRTRAVFDEMQHAAVEVGRQIVARERELDQLFSTQAIDPAELERRSKEIGQLQGELRAIHLRAHLQMMDVLSTDQVSRYIEVRGYHGAVAGEHHGHGGHGDVD